MSRSQTNNNEQKIPLANEYTCIFNLPYPIKS